MADYPHKQIKWTLDLSTGVHTCRHVDGETQSFDLTVLLPDGVWETLSTVAKRGFANGIAQKLGDLGAGFSYTPSEKATVFAERFDMMKANQWNLPSITSEEAKARRKERLEKAKALDAILTVMNPDQLQALVDSPVDGIPVEYVKAEITRRATQ
jgi:hypothetical protein